MSIPTEEGEKFLRRTVLPILVLETLIFRTQGLGSRRWMTETPELYNELGGDVVRGVDILSLLSS